MYPDSLWRWPYFHHHSNCSSACSKATRSMRRSKRKLTSPQVYPRCPAGCAPLPAASSLPFFSSCSPMSGNSLSLKCWFILEWLKFFSISWLKGSLWKISSTQKRLRTAFACPSWCITTSTSLIIFPLLTEEESIIGIRKQLGKGSGLGRASCRRGRWLMMCMILADPEILNFIKSTFQE